VADNSAASTDRKITVPIVSDVDIVAARQEGRALALLMGFSSTDATLVAAAISELARNIILYAKRGDIVVGVVEGGGKRGIGVVARDEGPGIPDVRRAMIGGYSTSGGLGLGLPGVRRLMDEFEIVSEPGRGTTVQVKKWRR
jgi:serine/threonine-protein kinase RsbT